MSDDANHVFDRLRGKSKAGGEDVTFVSASEVAMKPVYWLWRNRLALGKLTMLSGPSEFGKSTLSVDWIARLTRGAEWPDGGRAPLGSALLCTWPLGRVATRVCGRSCPLPVPTIRHRSAL